MSSFRKALVIGAALLALPALASAQTSRVEGMSLQGDYIKDYTGIYTYTSGVVNVGNLVYAELGTTTDVPTTTLVDRQVGAVLGNLWDGRFGTWGIHLRQWTPALGQGDAFSQPNPGNFGFDPNTNTNEAFDLMWGRKFGTTSLGLRLNRSYFRVEDAPPGITTTLKFDVPSGLAPALARNVLGIGGGIGFEMNPNTNVELSLLYSSRDYETSVTGGARSEDNGSSNWEVAGRAMWQWQPNVLVVPVLKFYSFDLGTKTTPPGGPSVTFDNTLSGWQAGMAGNWTIGTNDLFVLGATFAQNRLEQQEDILGVAAAAAGLGIAGLGDSLTVTEQLFPQIFAALETHVNNWLTLRFGANKGAYQKIKVEDSGAARDVEVNFADFNMNIGAGVKLGTLQLDAVLNNLFPQTLGGFFSNSPGGFISFPKVTATYAF